jgi:tetratricopeptide (TPR) repeat protein
MKSTAVIVTLIFTALAASAQTNPAPAQAASPSTPPRTQSAPSQQPAGTQVPPASGGHRVLQAKTQDELKAYQDAMTKTEPALMEAAADDFAAKYPTSELRASLYIRAMNLFAQQNDTDKVLITGRQAIAADPTNPIPLVQVASTLAESTRDTDLDREERLAEASKDAHAAIDNIDTGLLVPANADPARVEGAKHSILTMAYDTLGTVDMTKNDYASAETNLEKAVEESKGNPETVLYLRLSVAQDKLKKYPQALESANKAVQYSKDGTPAQNLAKQQQSRLQKLISAESPGSASSSSPAGGAPNPSQAPSSTSTPH